MNSYSKNRVTGVVIGLLLWHFRR